MSFCSESSLAWCDGKPVKLWDGKVRDKYMHLANITMSPLFSGNVLDIINEYSYEQTPAFRVHGGGR